MRLSVVAKAKAMPEKRWSHFHHGSDIGVRGIGASKESVMPLRDAQKV